MLQQGATYAAFVSSELDREFQRRASVISRAATAVTSAVGLVTLTVAAAAVIKGQLDRLHGGAVIGLLAGLIASLLAAIFALVASIDHQPYKVTSPDMLERLCTDDWADSEVTASNRVARSKITAIRTLRNGTKVRMIWLEWAYGVQILAIVSLAATFVSIVLQK